LNAAYDDIVQTLAPGSTVAEIEDYLRSREIPHDPPETMRGYPQRIFLYEDDWIPDDTLVIRAALVEEIGSGGPRWDVFFVLDDAQRLVRIERIEYGPDRL
jgi:hypothetical protein